MAQPTLTASLGLTILNPLPVLQTAVATDDGNFHFIVDVTGTGFVPQSSLAFDGSGMVSTYISATHLQATIPQSTFVAATTMAEVRNPDPGAVTSTAVMVALPQQLASISSASRLLDQSTFGAKLADIEHVRSIGLSAYLDEQLALPATTISELANVKTALPAYCNESFNTCSDLAFWQTALTAPDQVRQRVAFVLSEIWVVSDTTLDGRYFPTYSNTLAKDAFGNWRQLMEDVTLTPAMGAYLNLLNSRKPGAGQIANENFAREMLQLFSIGLVQLNQDGTQIVDGSGAPLPTDTLASIQGFAKAYTGWTFANPDGSAPAGLYAPIVFDFPLQPVPAFHDGTAKTLLRGVTLPAGQAPAEDLSQALDNIFADPTLPPFISQQLIRKLVKSNPTPQYVARVTATFVDNGHGERGDLSAVLRAILLDPEAREDDSPSATTVDAGHLREPILWLTSVLRGLDATPGTADASAYNALDGWSSSMGQLLHRSPSVFNYYSPAYQLPDTTTYAPEFEIENSSSTLARLNVANSIVANQAGHLVISLADPKIPRVQGPTFLRVDLSATSVLGQLASLGPDALLDRLNILFLNGKMPAPMRSSIKSTITGIVNPDQAARMAVYLVISSSQYKVRQ